ncbi:MAG: hypothetical protein V3T86_12995 [Planctomycetota bacterium]
MSRWLMNWNSLFLLVVFATPSFAQDGNDGEKAPEQGTKEAPAEGSERPATEIADDDDVVRAIGKTEKVRVLRPQDVPNELRRQKTRADIKAEVSLRVGKGLPVVFKGVIRNTKFIERLVKSRFVQQKDLKLRGCGLRLWWSGNSDGYIFFRYDAIDTLTVVGKLTAKERKALLERLRAKREGEQAAVGPKESIELEAMTPAERQAYLLAKYPYDKGWNHSKKRELSLKKILENQKLSAEDLTFLRYFHILAKARFEQLQQREDFEIKPGTQDAVDDTESDRDAAALDTEDDG